jgi:putative phage-type endonuclease
MSEQRSNEWLHERYGKFTASEVHKLLGVRGLGETGKTYAIEKAIEFLHGQMNENFVSYDMQRGVEQEPLAFEKFKSIVSLDFLEVETCGFFKDSEHVGASPDGLVSDDAILEIKCPNSINFFKLVAKEEIDSKYYAQMQHQMYCTNRSKAYFFNYLIHEGKEYHHLIIIKRDEDFISNMIDRIEEAIKIKLEYIKLINNNKQF